MIGLILMPLMYPEALPKTDDGDLAGSAAAATAATTTAATAGAGRRSMCRGRSRFQAPTKIPQDIKMVKEEPPPPTNAGVAGMEGMGGSGAIGGILGGMGSAPARW